MRSPGGPLFLAKSVYRRRRLNDAARLLPVFGALLIFLPVLWAPADGAKAATTTGGLYLFGIWLALIGAAALLAPGLRRNAEAGTGRRADASTDVSTDASSGDRP